MKKEHIQFDTLAIVHDPSGTGGRGEPLGEVPEATLNGKLQPYGLSADALRERVVEQLTKGTIGGGQIAVGTGGDQSALATWDLLLFDGQETGRG